MWEVHETQGFGEEDDDTTWDPSPAWEDQEDDVTDEDDGPDVIAPYL